MDEQLTDCVHYLVWLLEYVSIQKTAQRPAQIASAKIRQSLPPLLSALAHGAAADIFPHKGGRENIGLA